jgi:hypothetical protein
VFLVCATKFGAFTPSSTYFAIIGIGGKLCSTLINIKKALEDRWGKTGEK